MSRKIDAVIFVNGRFPRRSTSWTEAEDKVVRDFFPDWSAMGRVLPCRSQTEIRNRVRALGLESEGPIWTSADIRRLKVRYPDASNGELLDAFPNMRYRQIERMAKRMRLYRRSRGGAGSELVTEIHRRAIEVGISPRRLDVLAGTATYFQTTRHANKPNLRAVLLAVDVLHGRMKIEWSDTAAASAMTMPTKPMPHWAEVAA